MSSEARFARKKGHFLCSDRQTVLKVHFQVLGEPLGGS
jgi:hypothetical protein